MAKGSIEKRGERSWRLVVEVGDSGNRDKEYKTIQVDDPALLRTTKRLQDYLDSQLHEFKREVESGEYIKPQKMKLDKFYESEWKTKYASNTDNLSPLSYKTYKTYYECHIKDKLGDKELGAIKTIHLVTFMVDLSKPEARKDGKEGPLAPGTIEYIYRVLKNILERATEWKLIKTNPIVGVKKPKVKHGKSQFYEEDEAQEVIDALYHESRKWRLFIFGALLAGCRRGELVGIEWSSVDFNNCTFSIVNSISLTEDGKAVEKDPKNDSSKDIIAVPAWYIEELKIHRREWLKNMWEMKEKGLWKGGDRQYVFHGGYGKPYYHSYPYRWWTRFVARRKLKKISFHDLRHSCATLLIESGATTKAVQGQLRHAREQTTSDIYAHITKKLSRETADRFNKFAPKNPQVSSTTNHSSN
ncbi:integrase [Paenibacillus sp. FSL P4-0081]|uniref:tyrosine-type recombinase/integrase n=1 Tax=Paenibacillus sp. FSL P4-0081 TaxID=1536769 RepID=UPI0004F62BBD|nr:site-specific integrase [Paenibacillus sp. FSL P4-0081]AIQ29317.1 integrase [Paenibacillus sp. FSL P4-0081]